MMFCFAFFIPKSIAYSLPLGVLVFCFGRGAVGLLVNKPIVALGRVSFSAYVWHFMVLNIVYLCRGYEFDIFGLALGPSYSRFVFLLLFVVAVTYLVSSVTYRFIEQPMIGFGNRFIEGYTQVSSRFFRRFL